MIPELSESDILNHITSGTLFENKNIFERIVNVSLGEIKGGLKVVFSIIAVGLLCGILKNIQSAFGRKC
ncbi:MAG: hypothetical protein IJ215_02065 [Clostridia bacterium]|nr:hypothetical protein [Clostridia bacterium]